MNRPQTHEFPDWANKYISLVANDVLYVLEDQSNTLPKLINSLVEKADYAYAPGKWTVKELVGHIIDTERILVYRLMCIARGEIASLPGFDEDSYVANAHFKDRSLFSLAEEFTLLRKANLYLLKSFNETELDKLGIANNNQISVRAIIWVLAGHIIHHINIINERYK
jgi:hypothetical protein